MVIAHYDYTSTSSGQFVDQTLVIGLKEWVMLLVLY